MSVIDSDVSSNWTPLPPVTMTGSAQKVSTIEVHAKRGVQLKADPANNAVIKVGSSDVANSYYPLSAGNTVFIPTENTDEISVLGTASDKLFVFVV